MTYVSVLPRDMPFHLLEEITDGFSEERKLGSGAYGKVYMGVHKDGEKIAVKILNDMPEFDDNEKQFEKEFNNLTRLQHQNIVRLVGFCYEIQKQCVEYNKRTVLAEKIHRALCFEYMPNGSLDKYLSDEYSGYGWQTRYAIIKGICKGLKHLHEESESPIYHLDLKPENVLLDENMVPKIADFGLSRLFGEERTQITKSCIGTIGYLPPEYIKRNVISIKFDIFSLGVVIIKIMAGSKGYFKSDEMSAEQFIELVHGNWMNRLQETSVYKHESYSEQVKRCIEIAVSCVDEDRHKRPSIGDIVNKLNKTETIHKLPNFPHALRNDTESFMDQTSPCTAHEKIKMDPCIFTESELLDVHPLQLRFSFQPNKLVSCPLHVTNNTDDHHVAFRCFPKIPQSYYDQLFWLRGIVPPRSSCTYIVTMEKQEKPPADMDALAVIVKSCVAHDGMETLQVDDSFFRRVREENRVKVHEVTLIAVCDHPTGEMMTSEEATRPAIEIIACRFGMGHVTSIDVHPTKPWFLVGHLDGIVSIWNYETQAKVTALRIAKQRAQTFLKRRTVWRPSICSAKFIARKQWFVATDGDGYIYVYTYMTMDKLEMFKAHEKGVNSLVVHPTDPFVLSASEDHEIKLWDWEAGWDCIRTFVAHSSSVEQIMFNPQDGNTFASVSIDCTVQIWSIVSSDPLATLECYPDEQVCVDYFSIVGGQQYVVTGSSNGTARIWDLQTERCIRRLEGLQCAYACNIGVVDCLPDRPILITASEDNSVALCNSVTYRHGNPVNFKLGKVHGFAYVKSIKRLFIGCDEGVAIMEIDVVDCSSDVMRELL